jgi:hypothetical protein
VGNFIGPRLHYPIVSAVVGLEEVLSSENGLFFFKVWTNGSFGADSGV